MKKPKIKYETRCFIPKSLEPVTCPIDVKFIPKQGTYYILKEKVWITYAFKNNNWYYLNESCVRKGASHDICWNLLPNLREIEWDALKLVGHDKLNKRWQKILFARECNDSSKKSKRESLKRKLHNSKLK